MRLDRTENDSKHEPRGTTQIPKLTTGRYHMNPDQCHGKKRISCRSAVRDKPNTTDKLRHDGGDRC